MGRVAAQGDTRPMAASREAMDDLRRILGGRAAFYSKADPALDTTGRSLDESLAAAARTWSRERWRRPAEHEAKFISSLTA